MRGSARKTEQTPAGRHPYVVCCQLAVLLLLGALLSNPGVYHASVVSKLVLEECRHRLCPECDFGQCLTVVVLAGLEDKGQSATLLPIAGTPQSYAEYSM